MDEKEYIYQRLDYLMNTLQYQSDTIDRLLTIIEKQAEFINIIQANIETLSSQEFFEKQYSEMKKRELAEKMYMMKNIAREYK